MKTLYETLCEHTQALRNMQKAINRLVHNGNVKVKYQPHEESVHVRKITRINVFDMDNYFQYELKDGEWKVTVDNTGAPF